MAVYRNSGSSNRRWPSQVKPGAAAPARLITLRLDLHRRWRARSAGRLGLKHHVADMLPADKAEYVLQLRRDGRVVAMVGDGINGSPALSFADVGIAMKPWSAGGACIGQYRPDGG